VLADIVRSSRWKYRPCVMVHQFCWATKPCPQKLADFVVCLTSPLQSCFSCLLTYLLHAVR